MHKASSDTLRVSVVVPVYNRPSELRELLAALVLQSVDSAEFEVLICDDGSTVDLRAVVDEFNTMNSLQIHYFRQHNQGPGIARNLGLHNAGGAIVAFTDSDCIPEPEWLSELIGPIETSSVGMTGGLVDFRTADHLSGRCVNYLMSSMLGAGGARDPRAALHMRYYPRAGNTAVRRELACAAGGFSGQRHGEDIEFSNRILQMRTKIEFVPTAVVVHNEKKNSRQVAMEAFQKGTARIRLAREQGVHELIHTLPALLVVGLTASALTGLFLPAFSKIAGIPTVLYAIVLALIGLHGGFLLKDVRALLLLPFYASLMHIGYGAGYLYAFLTDPSTSVSLERQTVAAKSPHDGMSEQ
ncbi:MAG: glycosyltransferase [Planctomycetaceae bacterium]|nr:glycosyltransferase [Planctomycetales bacterium]MCB9924580.1 glycosyltransferase [Planctomycetaceae bacterium]